nr:MAG TPA: hypothetical protein [Caudoviricetes sp.]
MVISHNRLKKREIVCEKKEGMDNLSRRGSPSCMRSWLWSGQV